VIDEPTRPVPGTGLRRLVDALRYSGLGLRHALRHETAIRQELLLMALLTPVSLCLHVGRLEHLLLILSMLLVVLVEFLNSAVESAVDRISTDPHPLSGQAKDLGSAAVLIALIMWALTWGVIAGPLALGLLRGR